MVPDNTIPTPTGVVGSAWIVAKFLGVDLTKCMLVEPTGLIDIDSNGSVPRLLVDTLGDCAIAMTRTTFLMLTSQHHFVRFVPFLWRPLEVLLVVLMVWIQLLISRFCFNSYSRQPPIKQCHTDLWFQIVFHKKHSQTTENKKRHKKGFTLFLCESMKWLCNLSQSLSHTHILSLYISTHTSVLFQRSFSRYLIRARLVRVFNGWLL